MSEEENREHISAADMEAYLESEGGDEHSERAARNQESPEAPSSKKLGHVTASDGLHIGMDEHVVKAFITTQNRNNDIHVGDYVQIPYPRFDDNESDLPPDLLFTAVSGLDYAMDTTLEDLSDIPGMEPDFEIEEDDYPLLATLDPVTILRHDRNAEGELLVERGAIDTIPKPFEAVSLVEDETYLCRGLNLPQEGLPLGHVAVGGEPVPRSRTTPLVYNLSNPDPNERDAPAIFRHLLIAGSTGKGKTHASKNIIRQAVGGPMGPAYAIEDSEGQMTAQQLCTVIIDPENEYAELAQDPQDLTSDEQEQLQEYDEQGFRSGGVDDLVAFIPTVQGVDNPGTAADREVEFGIPFAVVNGRPDLLIPFDAPPATRNAITRVIRDYFSGLDDLSEPEYDDFMTFVRGSRDDYVDTDRIHESSWNAMMSRLAQRTYNDVFDRSQSLLDIEEQLFHSGRVSVIPTSHLRGGKERLVIMSLIAHIVDNKIDDQDPSEHVKYNPLMLCVDEAHNYLASRATAQQEYIVSRFVEAAKQGRKDKLALYTVTQNPEDIDEEIRKQTNTRVYLGLEEEVLERINVPRGFRDRIPLFGRGQMMVKAPDVQPTEVQGLNVCLTLHTS